MNTLVFLGDSTVAAGRNEQIKKANRIEQLGAGWAGQLAGRLLCEQKIQRAFNFANNGALISDIPKQLQLADKKNADLLIIGIGINHFWLHSQTAEQVWRQYYDCLRTIETPMLLIEPVAFASVMKKPLSQSALSEFQQLARIKLPNYLPVQALLENKGFSPQDLLYDGIHPTAIAHQLIVQMVNTVYLKQKLQGGTL